MKKDLKKINHGAYFYVDFKEKDKGGHMAFEFEIVEHIGLLSENPRGWTKEINRVSFNGQEAKYDIRQWSPDHEKMSKGISFSKEELNNLKHYLEELDLD